MPDPDSSGREPRAERATGLWVSAVVLAAVATGVLVLTDDARLLRLGLVAALWAALIAAFAVAKLRNRIAEDDDRADEMQRVYELELEREVAARREFELEAETEARRKAAAESEHEVAALRTELRNLRDRLEQIVGGDVLFERVALRAESTRMRSLPESGGQQRPENRVIEQPQQQQRGRVLPAGNANEANTEMMKRLSGEQQRPQRPGSMSPPQQTPPVRESPRPRYVPPAGHTPPVDPQRSSRPRPGPPQQSPPQQSPPAPKGAPTPNPAPAGEEPAPAKRTAPGAHTEGTSVNEILAAYGGSQESTKHRRRRE